MRTVNDELFNDEVDGAATYSSQALDAYSLLGAYFRVETTGTAAGDIQLQATVYENPTLDAHWDNYGTAVAYTAGQTKTVEIKEVFARHFRVQLVNASGTSTAVVRVNAKSF